MVQLVWLGVKRDLGTGGLEEVSGCFGSGEQARQGTDPGLSDQV